MITFQPNCSLPSGPAFVRTPNVRSTLDITWSCLAILILSCWSVLHLHAPDQFKPRNKSQYWRLILSLAITKLRWMTITIFAPEVIFAKATVDWKNARELTPKLRSLAQTDGVEWTESHTHFADMGGFRIYFARGQAAVVGSEAGEAVKIASNAVLTAPSTEHAHRAFEPDPESCVAAGSSMRPDTALLPPAYALFRSDCNAWLKGAISRYGNLDWKPFDPHVALIASIARSDPRYYERHRELMRMSTMLEGDVWTLTARQLLTARERGLLDRLPSISEEELADKSDSNILLKVLAIVQVSWMVVQVISRAVTHQTSTPLEVMAIAFAACASIRYLLCFNRPQGVETPTYTDSARAANASDIEALIAGNRLSYSFNIFSTAATHLNSVSNSHRGVSGYYDLYMLSLVLSSVLFGGLHLLAWNFEYPSEIEGLLWKISAVTTMLAPGCIALTVFLFVNLIDESSRWLRLISWTFHATWSAELLVLLLARLFLLVEVFRSLYYLPVDAYRATWASSIPHVG